MILLSVSRGFLTQ